MSGDVVSVIQGPTPVISVVQAPVQVIGIVSVGPQGPPGSSGSGAGTEYVQAVAASVWGPIAHGFGRRPNVTVYLGGEAVAAFITADATHVTISFPSPVTGSAVLT